MRVVRRPGRLAGPAEGGRGCRAKEVSTIRIPRSNRRHVGGIVIGGGASARTAFEFLAPTAAPGAVLRFSHTNIHAAAKNSFADSRVNAKMCSLVYEAPTK